MFYYTSFYRHRDASGKIIGYTLRNEQTFEWMQVTSEQLKEAMYHKRVHIFNLKLTSDGRIVETSNPLPEKKMPSVNKIVDRSKDLTSVEIYGDNDDLGYLKNQAREDTLERRVKHDGIFELNKFLRFFTRNIQSRTVNTRGGWDEFNDSDGDGIIGDGGGGDYDGD